MSRIVLSIESKKDKQLLLSLARRLNIKVVRVEEEQQPFSKTDDIRQTLANRFAADCKKHPELAGNAKKAMTAFKNVIGQLPVPALQQLVFSLTDSESIYFRFPLQGMPESETHLEIFFEQDAEADDLEAVVNIYLNDKVIAKRFGTLEDAFTTINRAAATPADKPQTAPLIHALS